LRYLQRLLCLSPRRFESFPFYDFSGVRSAQVSEPQIALGRVVGPSKVRG
jgi:hypothetical protein